MKLQIIHNDEPSFKAHVFNVFLTSMLRIPFMYTYADTEAKELSS